MVREPKSVDEFNDIAFMLLSRLDSFKNYLLIERKIALQNVRGKGYRLVPPQEQAEYAAREYLKQVVGAYRKAEHILEHTRMDGLTDEQKKRHIDTQVRISGIRAMTLKQSRDVFRIFKKDDDEAA